MLGLAKLGGWSLLKPDEHCLDSAWREVIRRSWERESPFLPTRSVNVTAAEAAALRELSNRFPPSHLARQAAINAVCRCARLVEAVGKNEVAVLCRGSNRIDVLSRDEYLRDSHKNLWDT